MNKKLFFSLFFAIAGITLFSFVEKEDPLRKTYAETITAADLKKHLSVIASDEYEGRETAKKGQHMTAEYIAKQFMLFGVLPASDKAYWERVPTNETLTIGAPWNKIDLAKMAEAGALLPMDYYQNVPLVQLTPGDGTVADKEKMYSFGKDFYYMPGISDNEIDLSKIVFAGYGIQDSLYRDYDGVDVKGKVEIILSEEPRDKNGNSIITGKKELSGWSTQRRRKAIEAKNRGAEALFIVIPNFQKTFSDYKSYIEKPTLELDDNSLKKDDKNIPVLYISTEMANEIFAAGKQKKSVKKISTQISKKKVPVHFEFPLHIILDIKRKQERLNSENVLGYIEGSDLKNELVVVTAHMDHLGIDTSKTGDKVFNGADDDGSGTVAVSGNGRSICKSEKRRTWPAQKYFIHARYRRRKGIARIEMVYRTPGFSIGKYRLRPEH
jgi:hypothetical protein